VERDVQCRNTVTNEKGKIKSEKSKSGVFVSAKLSHSINVAAHAA